jgi:riboflavin synthase
MFTGIIEEVGTVRRASEGEIAIAAKRVLWGTNLGDSISVNGVDLTAKHFDEEGFEANVMPETYNRAVVYVGQNVTVESNEEPE